ncbi:MAG: hypothetical protein JWL80_631 [Parcubacteria group bacterium]|nr:hypothetical protein [Parcubacteria group bacterium]
MSENNSVSVYVDVRTNQNIMTNKFETTANDIVSPQNTEKLYGKKANQNEILAGQEEKLEIGLPDDGDGLAEENLFSNPK